MAVRKKSETKMEIWIQDLANAFKLIISPRSEWIEEGDNIRIQYYISVF
jgi:hypothetical protein